MERSSHADHGRCSTPPTRLAEIEPSVAASFAARAKPQRAVAAAATAAKAPPPVATRRSSSPARSHRSRVLPVVRRGARGERGTPRGAVPAVEQLPQDAEALHDLRASFPYATRQAHGSRTTHQQVLVEHQVAAGVASSPDAAAPAGRRVDRSRRRGGHPRLMTDQAASALSRIDIAAIMARTDPLSGHEGRHCPPLPCRRLRRTDRRGTASGRKLQRLSCERPWIRAARVFRKETTVASWWCARAPTLRRTSRRIWFRALTAHATRWRHRQTAGAPGRRGRQADERYIRKLFDNGHGMAASASSCCTYRRTAQRYRNTSTRTSFLSSSA